MLLNGCGYTLQGSTTVLPGDVRRVYVPLVENETPEPGLALVMTEAIRERFERFGVITVVDSPAEADATLTTTINRVQRRASAVTARTEASLQQDTSINVSAELRRATGGLLWKADNMTVTSASASTGGTVVTSSAGFFGGNLSSGDLGGLSNREVSRDQEQQLLERLCEDVAKKMYDQAVAPDF